jgi:hypothetical protein
LKRIERDDEEGTVPGFITGPPYPWRKNLGNRLSDEIIKYSYELYEALTEV